MFQIEVAELVVRIENLYPDIRELCRDYITGDDRKADICVSVSEEELQTEIDKAPEYFFGKGYAEGVVAYEKISNALVFNMFDQAVAENPDATPLFHSDRGYQYTSRIFHAKLEAAGMRQSMSRVAHCIDNGPMEGFWGILKRERYYGRRFLDRTSLVKMIEDYISYYNNRRLQRNLGVLTPMEKHNQYKIAA